jgi:hypothetical protein
MPLYCHSPIEEDSPGDHTHKIGPFYLFTVLIFKSLLVRFRLPLTPPQGTEIPPKSMLYGEVVTQDSLTDVPKVTRSAFKWTKVDLGLPGVDYQYRELDDIQIGIEDATRTSIK